MAFITVGKENTADISLYYEDHGSGPAVVLLSGWPLDSRSWEPQVHPLLQAGHRVISYDRRGFGQSSRPTEGYDFDTLASDLDKLLTELDVREATLVGFSLGTGELARYIGTYGTGRLKGCVFIESLAPSFVKSDENPNGVDQATIDTIRQAILDDRPAWLTGLLGDFLNLDELLGKRVSEETVRNSWNAGAGASPWATWACVLTWLEDFHQDIKRIDIPALILHGTADRILSVQGQGRRMHAALPDAHYAEIEGGPARHVRHPRQGGQPGAAGVPAQQRSRPRGWLNPPLPPRRRLSLAHYAAIGQQLNQSGGPPCAAPQATPSSRPTRSRASSSAPNSSTAHPQSPDGRSCRCSPRSRAASSRAGTSIQGKKSGTSSPGRCR